MSQPNYKAVNKLVNGLVEKGTPGIILLALIFLVPWVLIGAIIFDSGSIFPNAPDSCDQAFYTVLVTGLFVISAILTYHITNSIAPIIKAESEAESILQDAFGGKKVSNGEITKETISEWKAQKRIKNILTALIKRVQSVVTIEQKKSIRANIFVMKEHPWLTIDKRFSINMENSKENNIKIWDSFYSTGSCFSQSQPVFCDKSSKQWDHPPDLNNIMAKIKSVYGSDLVKALESIGSDKLEALLISPIKAQLDQAEPKLSWIISMPILYQTDPFKITCGVLNIDSLESNLYRDQIMDLLPDIAVAAALIGSINRNANILKSYCSQDNSSLTASETFSGQLYENFMIKPNDFDPADCPPPSEAFKKQLEKINGLGFFKNISTDDVAKYIRNQLC